MSAKFCFKGHFAAVSQCVTSLLEECITQIHFRGTMRDPHRLPSHVLLERSTWSDDLRISNIS